MDTKQIEKCIEEIGKSLENHERSVRACEKALTNYKVLLAEAEKPEKPEKPEPGLRHGEMRIWRKEVSDTMTEDLPVIVDLSCREPRILFRGSNGESLRVEYSEEKILRLSNHVSYAIADLTALSEDVEEVGRDDLKNKAAHNAFGFKIVRGSIHYHGDEHACFSYAEFAELVLKLRQMAATAARKAGKTDAEG